MLIAHVTTIIVTHKKNSPIYCSQYNVNFSLQITKLQFDIQLESEVSFKIKSSIL